MFTEKWFLKKSVSFLICVMFVLAFLAGDHDRIQESGRKLICRFDRSSACWKCGFRTGFTGFSAFSFLLPGASDSAFCKADVELSPVGGPADGAKTFSEAVLSSTPVQLNFSPSDVQDWQLTIRPRETSRLNGKDLHLNCNFYAGKTPRSYYWCGILAAGLLFIVLGIAEHFLTQRKNALPDRKGKRPDFDYGIHYFRAMAIFFIMILHYSYLMPNLKFLNSTLFSSASYFFIFISGYLFYHLTGSFEKVWTFSKKAPYLQSRTVSGKFSVPVYYKKKILNILLPYFLTATAIYAYIWLYSDTTQLVPAVPGTWQDYFFRIRTGAVQRSHWYIYFISKIYLISPLLLFLPRRLFMGLTAASCVLPFVFSRTESHFCYFLPMYLLGMVYARYRLKADRILFHPAVKAVISVLVLGFLIYLYPGREEQDGMIFIIRLLSTVFLLYIAVFLSRWKLSWLSYCADISFTLFFIHDFIFAYVTGPVRVFYAPLYRAIPWLEVLVPLSMILIVIIVASALKILFGVFSRRVIGS